MRVFVTGVKGQLGHDVMNELAKRGHEGIGVDIEEMDITDAESVRKVITEANPDVVIHCAAWTAVDLAEDDDKKEKADRRIHRTAFICTGFFRTKSREIKNRNVFAARNDRTLYAAREKDHLLIPYFGRIRRRRFFHRRGVLSPPEKIISSL